jgi:hypothetical protein
VRPQGAPTVRLSLVPAYRACDSGSATLQHGTPLSHPSCGSPALTSGYLTLGTNSTGFARLTQQGEPPPINPNNGDQADVAYRLRLTGVSWAADSTDYGGELRAEATLRLTDRDNSPSGTAPATLDTTIAFDVPCTIGSGVGGTCNVTTSQEAVVAGSVKEGKRSVWELGRLRVLDGGADGDTATGPNTLFAVQGVFVP